MKTARRILALLALTLGLPVLVSACLNVPAGIATDCSSDAAPALSAWLSGLPNNSVVELPPNACFDIATTLDIHNTTGLQIGGNGARFIRTQSGGTGTTDPLVQLTQNTNLSIGGISITGAYDGTNGGAAYEGQYGLRMEANHGVKLTGITETNVQGDFLILDKPDYYDVGNDSSLNTNVSITGSTFTNAGYHGVTVESANGLTISNDTFNGMGVDAIDMEVDVYSTQFDAQGNPQGLAEDNINISNNTWTNFQNDWFASLQGQLPGVQEQNVTLSGNTINAPSPLIEITGTNPYLTTSQYWNSNLTIANNTGLQPAIGYRGGSIATPYSAQAMSIQAVVGVTITGNTLPMFDGTPTYFANTPYLGVLQAIEDQNLIVGGNNFSGGLGVIDPSSVANTGVGECSNTFGVNGSQTDGPCP